MYSRGISQRAAALVAANMSHSYPSGRFACCHSGGRQVPAVVALTIAAER